MKRILIMACSDRKHVVDGPIWERLSPPQSVPWMEPSVSPIDDFRAMVGKSPVSSSYAEIAKLRAATDFNRSLATFLNNGLWRARARGRSTMDGERL